MTNEVPHDREAEEAVLGSVIIDPIIYNEIEIEPSDFYILRNQQVWQAFQNIASRDEPFDFIVLSSELDRMKSDVDPAYVTRLMNSTPDAYNAKNYASIVKSFSAKRKMINTFTAGVNMCYNGKTPDEIMSGVTNELGRINVGSKTDDHVYSAKDAAGLAYEATINSSSGERAFKFGIKSLDDILYVLKKDLIIVGGRPGTGKTVALITAVANNPNKRGLFLELETGVEQATQRILSQLSGIPAYRIVRGQLKESEVPQFTQAVEEFSTWNTVICDMPAMKLSQMVSIARKENAKNKLDYILVDYLQLASGDGRKETRAFEVGSIAKGLKDLAKELSIPIIVAAQINRLSEISAEKRPQLHNLKESGDIEQAADSVVFVHIQDNNRMMIVAKQRMGPPGDAQVYFNEELMRFEDANITNFDPNNYGNR